MRHKIFILSLWFFAHSIFTYSQKTQSLPYKNKDLPIEERVEDLLSRMTLDEKIAQIRHIHSWDIFNGQVLDETKLTTLAGDISWGFVEGFPLTGENCAKNMYPIQKYMVEKTRLGIPIFTVAESLHGVVHDGATIFPQNIALGSTFEPRLAREKARMISDELHNLGFKQVLAPCIDVVRELRWGRVEESYGEDPYLCGLFGIEETSGYLESGISPMLKHYGPHGNPLSGLNLASVECGLRDLHEIYLKPFEMVVKNTGILAVMSTYNSWNRVPNSASHYLLTDILRDQWGFKGYVYSDWGAIEMLKTLHFTARNSSEAAMQAISAGLDVEASSECYPFLKTLIEKEQFDEEILNTAVRRVLFAKFAMGLFEDPYGEQYKGRGRHTPESIQLAKRIADESTVLLKNENRLLPLDVNQIKSIAVIGPNADQVQFGDYSWSRSNKDGVTPLQGIKDRAGDKVTIRYAKGCSLTSLETSGIAEAVEAARQSDVAIIFGGSASAALARDYKSSTCGEGFDLNDLNLTGAQSQLIREVYQTGTPVVLVLVTGKPFAIEWEKNNLAAILVQWYAGEQAGYSIADILFGNVVPSGRLTFSFPRSTGHLPVYYNYLPSDRGFYHNPGSYEAPGRDYVFSSPTALYPFGYGLSYTSFVYKNLSTDKDKYSLADTIRAAVEVKNTGEYTGKEVVQLYVRDKASTYVTPVKQLRDFQKIELAPGESRTVHLDVPIADLYLVDENNRRFVEAGEFIIEVGQSAENIILSKTVVAGEPSTIGDDEIVAPNVKESSQRIQVRGEVRDIQATLVPGMQVIERSTGKTIAVTDDRGQYHVTTGNHEYLIFKKPGYRTTEIEINNRDVINMTVNYGEN